MLGMPSAFGLGPPPVAAGSSAISGVLTPSASNTYDLGSSTFYWKNIYANSLNFIGGGFAQNSMLAGASNETMIVRGAYPAGGAGPDIALRAVNDRTAGKVVSVQDNNGSTELAYFTFSGRMGMGLGGTALVAGDFDLADGGSTDFGTTASISSVTATDVGGVFTITSAGTGQTANPTVTLTFKDGAWPATPKMAVVCRAGGSQRTVPVEVVSISTTQLVIAFLGTPVAAETYTIRFLVIA